jgi:hypothetical protein
MNTKPRETDDDSRKVKNKIKPLGDNEDPTNRVIEE